MAYKVLVDFADLQDNSYVYHEGDAYPREGAKPSAGRLKELSGKTNRMGFALIKEVGGKKASGPASAKAGKDK